MRPEVVRHLTCPVCRGPLALTGSGPLRCPRGHSFDQARQGYAQLTAAPLAHPGDTAAMVDARGSFLGAGHYAMITAALRDAASPRWPGGLVVDVGAGTGHHLAGVLDALPDAYGLATDVSKAAARAAARAHQRADSIICDAWQPLPIADGAAGIVLNVFAPRPGTEFARILRPDGALVMVIPTPDHLVELREPLGLLSVDATKGSRVARALDGGFRLRQSAAHTQVMTLGRADIASLVGMGPSAHHIDTADLAARIAHLGEPVDVTASVTVAVYAPR